MNKLESEVYMFNQGQKIWSDKFGNGYISTISNGVITCIYPSERSDGEIVYYNEEGVGAEDKIFASCH